jgi:hypothetical protein
MTTMKEQRIIEILNELSFRVAVYNTTLDDLCDDFIHRRRASMQIRKSAHKCINNSTIVKDRFLNIAIEFGLNEDCAMFSIFKKRAATNDELAKFFS